MQGWERNAAVPGKGNRVDLEDTCPTGVEREVNF